MTNSEISTVMDDYLRRVGRSAVLALMAEEASRLASASLALSRIYQRKKQKHSLAHCLELREMLKAVSNLEILEIMLDVIPLDSYQAEFLELMKGEHPDEQIKGQLSIFDMEKAYETH